MNDKLIAVGMRFAKQAYVSLVRVGTQVVLQPVPNKEAPGGVAISVCIYTGGAYQHVAYIRNNDLQMAKDSFRKNCIGDITQFRAAYYKIDQVRTNYLVLSPQELVRYSKVFNTEGTTTGRTSSTETVAQELTSVLKEASNKLTEEKKESTKMALNPTNMRDQFFREVKNVAIDIQTGKFGILNSDGIAVYDNNTINVNPIQELGVKIPAFAMRVPAETLKAGDIVFNGNEAGFFVEAIKEGGYKLMSTSGEVTTVGNVKNMFFGANSVLAVKNMFAGSGMNPMMMAMFMGDGKMDMKTIALMSMMGGQSGGMDSNMLMMMMLMGDK